MTNTPDWNPVFDTDRPAGRWARILRLAAGPRAPLALGELKRGARRRESPIPTQREKFKTLRAVRSLVDMGLLARTTDGFITTTGGLQMLASCRPPTADEAAILADAIANLAADRAPTHTFEADHA